MKTYQEKIEEVMSLFDAVVAVTKANNAAINLSGMNHTQLMSSLEMQSNSVAINSLLSYCRDNFQFPSSFGYHGECSDLTFFSDSGRSLDEFKLTDDIMKSNSAYFEWKSKFDEIPESMIILIFMKTLLRYYGAYYDHNCAEFSWFYEGYGALVLR